MTVADSFNDNSLSPKIIRHYKGNLAARVLFQGNTKVVIDTGRKIETWVWELGLGWHLLG